jgi:hypothetical protein
MSARWIVALGLALAACEEPGAAVDEDGGATSSSGAADDDGTRPPMDLVEPDLWLVEPGADPMPTHAPAQVACAAGFGEEYGVFEVDTQSCNYGVFTQPLRTNVRAGDLVEFTVTHDDLIADEPAVGHIAVAFADRVVFDAEVEIPHAYGIVTAEWIADVDVPADTRAVLHLHNHGFNQWRMVAIVVRSP